MGKTEPWHQKGSIMEEKIKESDMPITDNGSTVQYDEENIRHLSDMEHVRTRPGLYIERLGDG